MLTGFLYASAIAHKMKSLTKRKRYVSDTKGIEMTIEELVIRCEMLEKWAKLLKNCQPENRDYLMKTLMVESTRTADACQEYYLGNYGGATEVLNF